MKVDPIRLTALDILVQVDAGEDLDPLLNQAQSDLEQIQDRAFLATLVKGTIQWRERYRHILGHFVNRSLPESPVLRQLLFLSVHQLLGMNAVPAYAAIHQAGELCRLRASERQVGFVNGVLQNIGRRLLPKGGKRAPDSPDTIEPQKDLEAIEKRLLPLFDDLRNDHVRWLATWYSHPGWLVERWCEAYGPDRAEEICVANNVPVELAFRVLQPADPERIVQEMGEEGCPVERLEGTRTLITKERLARPDLRKWLERFAQLIVQDPVVQEATQWLLSGADAMSFSSVWSRKDLVALDMCAAPGGKTACLAAAWPEISDAGQTLVAMDNRPERMELLRDTLQRTRNDDVRIIQADARLAPLADASCSAVLLDGPCSGTGVLRHHPEGRWRLQRRSPRRNGKLLLQLAEKAADLLAPGGLLMYATCSLEAPENQDVMAALLDSRNDLQPLPDGEGHWQRQWVPGPDGGDGFFGARLQKVR